MDILESLGTLAVGAIVTGLDSSISDPALIIFKRSDRQTSDDD